MTKDQKAQYINIAIVAIVILAIGVMWFKSAKPADDNQVKKVDEIVYSEDNQEQPFKTLNYDEAIAKLTAKNSKQMFYVGCRNCGHCNNLETVLTDFLGKYESKNKNRDLIYKIEAGYDCVPKEDSDQYAGYEKIYQFLVDNKLIEANEGKSFGTPQFFYVENGKIKKGELGERSVAGLEKFFKANKYRI